LRWRRVVWKEKDEREEEEDSCAGLRTCRPQKERRGESQHDQAEKSEKEEEEGIGEGRGGGRRERGRERPTYHGAQACRAETKAREGSGVVKENSERDIQGVRMENKVVSLLILFCELGSEFQLQTERRSNVC